MRIERSFAIFQNNFVDMSNAKNVNCIEKLFCNDFEKRRISIEYNDNRIFEI